jgi:hypothetical protein
MMHPASVRTAIKQGYMLSLGSMGGGLLLMNVFPRYDTSVPDVCMLSKAGIWSLILWGAGLGWFVGILVLTLSLWSALRACHVPCQHT